MHRLSGLSPEAFEPDSPAEKVCWHGKRRARCAAFWKFLLSLP